jgi:hypothetical protein
LSEMTSEQKYQGTGQNLEGWISLLLVFSRRFAGGNIGKFCISQREGTIYYLCSLCRVLHVFGTHPPMRLLELPAGKLAILECCPNQFRHIWKRSHSLSEALAPTKETQGRKLWDLQRWTGIKKVIDFSYFSHWRNSPCWEMTRTYPLM